MLRYPVLALLCLGVLAGCDMGGGQPLAIATRGAAVGTVFMDRNGNDAFDPTVDRPSAGVKVVLLAGERDTVATAVTDAGGSATMPEIPVGSYELRVDPAALGDSMTVTGSLPAVVVRASDTTRASIALAPPLVPADTFAELAEGKLVSVRGQALNRLGIFADSSVHLVDATGTLRIVGLPGPAVDAGDSLRVLGRVAIRNGHRVLSPTNVVVGGTGPLPEPTPVGGTGAARSADGGRLDAALVTLTKEAEIIDAASIAGGDLRLLVDDGSGALEVILSGRAGITLDDPPLPGATVKLTGLLVPDDRGNWTLKPRNSGDITVRIRTVPVDSVRGFPAGRAVAVQAVALNGWNTFGDGSLHVADGSGHALRAVHVVTAFVFAGDSVRLVGTVALRDGQTVLDQVTSTKYGAGHLPPALSLTTQQAARAQRATGAPVGSADAALVKVIATVVRDTTVAPARIGLNDGSGFLSVAVGGNTGIPDGWMTVGDTFTVTGVLVPNGNGWVLRPRSPADIVAR
jgi:hypothetical protein